MTADLDVIVVGELNADLILRGDVTPAFGQVEKIIDAATLTLGSSSAIFACGAARLGLRVAFIGKVGDDEFGRFVLRELDRQGVNTEGVTIDPTIPTGLSVILSRPDDRAILTHLGSIAALRFDEIDLARVARARHLHLGSFFLLDALRPDVPRLFDEARARGLSISIDTNYDPAEQWAGGLREVLHRVDVFFPNETELLAYTRETSIEAALDRVADIPAVAVASARGAVARRGSRDRSRGFNSSGRGRYYRRGRFIRRGLCVWLSGGMVVAARVAVRDDLRVALDARGGWYGIAGHAGRGAALS